MEQTIYLVYRDWSTHPADVGQDRAVIKAFTTDGDAAQYIQDIHDGKQAREDGDDYLELPPFLAEFGTPVSRQPEELRWAKEGEIVYAESKAALYSIEPLQLVVPDKPKPPRNPNSASARFGDGT